MRNRYLPHHRPYVDYYTGQVGRGFPVFQGARTQKGSGLGGILGGLFKSALPLIKQGAKTLGREALRTGVELAQDAIEGKDIRSAAKGRIRSAGRNLTRRALGAAGKTVAPTKARQGIKRKAKGRRTTASSSKRARRSLDIFD